MRWTSPSAASASSPPLFCAPWAPWWGATYGLIRLGLGRHGDWSLAALHPSWLVDPSLPWWRAHVENVGTTVAGAVLVALGVGVAAARPGPGAGERAR